MQGNLFARTLFRPKQAQEAEKSESRANSRRSHDIEGPPTFVVAEIGQTSPLATASNTLFITLQFDTHIPPRSHILIDNINCVDVIDYEYATEECDDGNTVDGDGCNSLCRLEVCGDGVNAYWKECDEGDSNTLGGPTGSCKTDCKLQVCGDADQGSDEECDDGNTVHGDGCTASCVVEFCGDGIDNNNNTEECDAGSAGNLDGGADGSCRPGCILQTCGDGDVGSDEGCDDGNMINGDGCSVLCEVEVCGDGIVTEPEECDAGGTDNVDGGADGSCKTTCFLQTCGDGDVGSDEDCDDGNTVDGDGCTTSCVVE
eukprot:3102693-Rhodomonas_salina.2